VDTNIWLDFYRARNETGLKLLEHLEKLSTKLIVTYQLESEFKKNRQAAIREGMQALKAPQEVSRPGIFSDAASTKIMARNVKDAEKRVKKLKARLIRALEDPALHDPVYQVCQRLFHKDDDLVLTRNNKLRHSIRRRALKRFFHGCPPRKSGDTSMGDSFNWEWMVHCAREQTAGLVIITRDEDYGITVDGRSYVNDHLRQEFSERVSKKRKLLLYSRLSDALKLFAVTVTPQEEEAEKEIVAILTPPDEDVYVNKWSTILDRAVSSNLALAKSRLHEAMRGEGLSRNALRDRVFGVRPVDDPDAERIIHDAPTRETPEEES